MSLTQNQIQNLQHLLYEKKINLKSQIQQQDQRRNDMSYVNLAGSVADAGDAANADLILDVDNAVVHLQYKELNEIRNAEQRIAHHEYGVCLDCNKDISYARLQVYPAATRCLQCQKAYEHRLAPHSSL